MSGTEPRTPIKQLDKLGDWVPDYRIIGRRGEYSG